jgi:hypothetical protein
MFFYDKHKLQQKCYLTQFIKNEWKRPPDINY